MVYKWKKYQLLFQYNLNTEEEISEQIKRFDKKHIFDMYDMIRNDLRSNPNRFIYVIKLVPIQMKLKLINYRVYCLHDLDLTLNDILGQNNYEEIWFCKNYQYSGFNSIYGRFYINSGDRTVVEQYIENIWADTARKIDNINSDFNMAFIQAKRPEWGWNYTIENIHHATLTKPEIMMGFREVINQIETKRKYIETMTDDLKRIGINSFDLEYKMNNGRLQIIDWDSAQDERIVQQLL